MKKIIYLIITLLFSAIIFTTISCEKEEENKKPTCSITNPTSGAKIPKDTTIIISVDAVDENGNLKEVRFYIDDSEIGVAEGIPYSYDWNTGNVSSGTHILKAKAIDEIGATAEDTVQISIGDTPNAIFSVDATNIYQGYTIHFTDQSTGNPESWLWDFGDSNTSTDQNPSHKYTNSGTFTVELTVSNDYGKDTERKSGFITVESLPIADFSADITDIAIDSTIQFTDESIGNPISWQWNFGDSNTSNQQNPSHAYSSEGTYTVELTVSSEYGEDTKTKTDYIIVGTPPTAAFSADQTEIKVGNSINFTDQSIDNPTSWLWDFGDSNTSTDQNPSHTYSSTGTYTIELTVSNKYGANTKTKTDYIIVEAFSIQTTTTGEGSIELTPQKEKYMYNEEVEINAIPNTGYEFIEWSGDLSGNTNPKIIQVTSDLNIIAIFKTPKDALIYQGASVVNISGRIYSASLTLYNTLPQSVDLIKITLKNNNGTIILENNDGITICSNCGIAYSISFGTPPTSDDFHQYTVEWKFEYKGETIIKTNTVGDSENSKKNLKIMNKKLLKIS